MAIFGVDSLELSTHTVASGQTLYDWVVSQGKTPQFWGRYLNGSGILTSAEVTYLHGKNCKIIPIFSGTKNCSNSNATQAQGNADGQLAVTAAKALSIPNGTVIYVDIESGYTPSSAWLQGYCDALWNGNPTYYTPGFYCDPTSASFTTPFNAAVAAGTSHIGLGLSMIWVSMPSLSTAITAALPAWNPGTFQSFAQNNINFWQYRENASAPNGTQVDLDEARDTAAMINIW